MSGPLLALVTCHAYDYKLDRMVHGLRYPQGQRRPAIKKTWLRDVDIPYKWFFGRPPSDKTVDAESDEVFLSCGDGYQFLPYKIKGIVIWALEHGYDRVIKVDDDTYIHWDRFGQRPAFFEDEYVGGCWEGRNYAFGGAYAISGRLLNAVATTPIPNGVWSDDVRMGELARAHGVPFTLDETVHYGPIDQKTMIQTVEESVLGSGHNYSVLCPMSPGQMVRYHAATPKKNNV